MLVENFKRQKHFHYYADNAHWQTNYSDGSGIGVTLTTAHTALMLFTGGKALEHHMSLIRLQCSGLKYGAPSGWPWLGMETTVIPPSTMKVLGQSPGSDGNLWVTLPDGDTPVDVTPQVGKPFYLFGAGQQKYESHFEVFVHQPWPDYPNDITSFGPSGPPQGYPIVNIWSDDVGHAWWELETEAPGKAIYYFSKNHCARWANSEVGFEAASGLDYVYAILHLECPTAPGKFPYYTSDPKDVQRTYAIGFPGLIGGLNHCETIYWNTPIYNLCNNNCVNQTFITGGAAGVALPNDWDPEDFGFDLPRSNP